MSSCRTRKSYPSVDSDRWQFLSLYLLIGFLKVVKVFIHYFVSLGGFFYVVNLSIPCQCVLRLSLLLFKTNLASIASLSSDLFNSFNWRWILYSCKEEKKSLCGKLMINLHLFLHIIFFKKLIFRKYYLKLSCFIFVYKNH